jgi:hypothetical protein
MCVFATVTLLVTRADIADKVKAPDHVSYNPKMFSDPALAVKIGPLLLDESEMWYVKHVSYIRETTTLAVVLTIAVLVTYLLNLYSVLKCRAALHRDALAMRAVDPRSSSRTD